MFANKSAELCMKIVPGDTTEYEYDSCAEYNTVNYEMIIKYYLKRRIGNKSIKVPVGELIDYICNLDKDDKFNIHTKSGVLFFYNGYALIGFTNTNQSTVPLINNKILLIDVNNYIFNKEFTKKTECDERFLVMIDRLVNIMINVFMCILIYALVLYVLFIINLNIE